KQTITYGYYPSPAQQHSPPKPEHTQTKTTNGTAIPNDQRETQQTKHKQYQYPRIQEKQRNRRAEQGLLHRPIFAKIATRLRRA
ncbi:hypothetical protein, partial [Meridianimarinicoccus sp. MJW13]|uniref:hypothetical protein n=1 Tax=Meridianimarinicoccus sp. MJW13 TaxID=2720031 RepID=UPI001D02AEC1